MSGFNLIENYIYFHHLDTFCVLPLYPENLPESNTASFSSTNALGRSNPVYSYSYSGPRTINLDFTLHREMMNDINITPNNFNLDPGVDIVEELINSIESAVLPKYDTSVKALNPPMISLRIGNELYIKGVVSRVGKDFSGPILNNNKYAVCRISFSLEGVDPIDAESVKAVGSYRGVSRAVERRVFRWLK